jgi:hypothetical protein
MAQQSLLRPEGLARSPAFSHVAVVPPGATSVYVGGQNAAAAVSGAAPPVVVMRVAGPAVPGALVEVSAVAAVTP